VKVLQRQLSEASKLVQSQQHGQWTQGQPVDSADRVTSPPTVDVARRQRSEDALKQSMSDAERRETFDRQQTAFALLEQSASLLANKDVELSQLKGLLRRVQSDVIELN